VVTASPQSRVTASAAEIDAEIRCEDAMMLTSPEPDTLVLPVTLYTAPI
jgi:hypothetical protein